MHNSNPSKNGQIRNRSMVSVIAVAVVFCLLLKLLDLALYPCTFMRNDIHAVVTRQYDDLIVGTSCGKMNIDPDTMQSMTGRSGHNVCVGGEYAIDAYYITKLAAEKQKPSRIIYEIGPGYFVTEKEEGNNYLLFYHEFPLSMTKAEYFAAAAAKIGIRSTLFPWSEYALSYTIPNIDSNLQKKLTGDYRTDDLKTAAQTYYESGFIGRNPVSMDSLTWSNPILFDQDQIVTENIEWVRKLVNFCKEEGIEFVAVTTPMPEASLLAYPDAFEEAWSYFENLFSDLDVAYLNFNTDLYDAFSHDLTGYTDFDGHMNEETAKAFSSVFARALNGEDVSMSKDTVTAAAEAVPVG